MQSTNRTRGRIFSLDKVVQSRALNIMGAQVLRTVLARVIYNQRAVVDCDPEVRRETAEKLNELEREGIVAWTDFLPSEQFEDLRRECLESVHMVKNWKVRSSGTNTDARLKVRSIDGNCVVHTHRFLADRRLRALLEAAERRPLGPLADLAIIEHLKQGPVDEMEDPQSELHSDIFFTSHKVWFYLTDVALEHGPLAYVKRSHGLTSRSLYFTYKESCTKNEGSRRITAQETSKLGQSETVLTCPRNTLVIANTCGFHRRLKGSPGRERYAIHLELRANPFGLDNRRVKVEQRKS